MFYLCTTYVLSVHYLAFYVLAVLVFIQSEVRRRHTPEKVLSLLHLQEKSIPNIAEISLFKEILIQLLELMWILMLKIKYLMH